jgi:anti-sigma factor RsiW
VAGPGGNDEHVREALGLYLLGALEDDARERVELHLAHCPGCCTEADELGTVVELLAPIDPQDIRDVIAEFGIPAGERPPEATVPAQQPAPRVGIPRTAARAGRAPGDGMRRPGSSREALTRRLRDRRSRALLALGALTAVLLVFVGMALGVAVSGTGGGGPTDIRLAATASAEDSHSGASLTVYISGDQHRVTVRATVSGLLIGTRYRLYAVTSDGRTWVVDEWLGSSGVQDRSGALAVAANSLVFFSVTNSGGATVVSAFLNRPSSATPG